MVTHGGIPQIFGPNPLKGKVAIVTGASRGIGRAVALGYAQAGAAVCCAARTTKEIDELVSQITKEGGKAISVTTDQGDLRSVENMVNATVKAFGGLDIMFANAALTTLVGPVVDSDPEVWRDIVQVNLVGAYYCARASIPHMKARGAGKIIFVGSGHGHTASPFNTAYSSAKAGMWMLTRALAAEVWQDNISVNEFTPGRVKTTAYERGVLGGGHAPERPAEWVKEPEDCVPIALFMACQPDKGPTANTYTLNRRFN